MSNTISFLMTSSYPKENTAYNKSLKTRCIKKRYILVIKDQRCLDLPVSSSQIFSSIQLCSTERLPQYSIALLHQQLACILSVILRNSRFKYYCELSIMKVYLRGVMQWKARGQQQHLGKTVAQGIQKPVTIWCTINIYHQKQSHKSNSINNNSHLQITDLKICTIQVIELFQFTKIKMTA